MFRVVAKKENETFVMVTEKTTTKESAEMYVNHYKNMGYTDVKIIDEGI